jgi:hypothetical protein
MVNITEKTFFAPSSRVSVQGLIHDVEFVGMHMRGVPFLDVSPTLMLILNECRQILYANESVISFLNPCGGVESVIGKRPGEAFNCENCKDAPGGCGTGRACRSCGAVISIMECLENGRKSSGECHLARESNGIIECLDLRVSSSPLTLDGRKYVAFTASDIGDERRRNYLEGVFIHEVRNSAGNVLTLGGLLKDECDGTTAEDTAKMLFESAERLMSDIDRHRMLISAETGSLKPEPVSFSSVQLLERLALEYGKRKYGDKERNISVSKDSVEMGIYGDPTILSCALGNLIMNSIEASTNGGGIVLSCHMGEACASFSVWNNETIAETVQPNIFHRSFSTKGVAHGIGTYMSRLLVTRYLSGEIGFKSSPGKGTVFTINIPFEDKSSKQGDEASKP